MREGGREGGREMLFYVITACFCSVGGTPRDVVWDSRGQRLAVTFTSKH